MRWSPTSARTASCCSGAEPSIFVATRDSRDIAFQAPEHLASITGFVEGPTISADGSALYFHRTDADRLHIYRVLRE